MMKTREQNPPAGGENREQKGFTLVEVVVGTAVFVVVALAIYGAYVNLFKFMNNAQSQELAIDLAEEQMEIIRNMPYHDVGVVNSIPSGNIPYQQTLLRGGTPFKVTAIIRNIDLAADGMASGTPSDTAPNDNKLVALTISCDACASFTPFTITSQVAPMSLESSGNTGSLFIHVHNAVGGSVQGANVTAVNSQGTSTITINDVSDNTGTLALVGVPPGTHAYHVTVGKTGYSSDQTYPLGGGGNPNPVNVDANVVTGSVTSADFFIDKLSSVNVSSVSPTCAVISNYHFHLTGSKQIGAGVPKYSQNLQTNGAGILSLPTMEWDTAYTVSPTDTVYDLSGVNPANPITVNPNSTINLQLVVVPKNNNSLMVSVIDNSTSLPLSGASVQLTKTGYNVTQITGQGFISQNDWSGGLGQDSYLIQNKYWNNDGNVDVSAPGNIRLRNAFGVYNPSGYLESSTFDTGTTSNFYNFIWAPTNEPASTSIKFQFATSPSSTPPLGWNFTGPDGTGASYYTVSNSSFNSVLNGNEYARYRAYLATATTTSTPTISSVGFTYTSACIPPGQVVFQGLSTGTYVLTISKAGYTTYSGNVTVSAGWQEKDQKI